MSQTTIDSFFKAVPKAGKKKKGLITDYYPVQSITRNNKLNAKSNSKKKPKNLKQTKMTDYFQSAPPIGAINTPRRYLSHMVDLSKVAGSKFVGALKAIPGGKIIRTVASSIPYVKKGFELTQKTYTNTTNHKRALKGMINNRITNQLPGTGLSRSNDILARWKNAKMKTRLNYAPYLQDVILDATKRQTEAIEKQNRYLKEQKEKYERIGGAPVSDLKPDEFGKVKDPLTSNYIESMTYKPFQFIHSNERELTKEEKEDMYALHRQRTRFNKKHHEEEMERLLKNVDQPNALIEERIKNISDEYKDLVKYETHDFISHPEEITFDNESERVKWQQFTNTMNTAIKTAADVARLATEKFNPIGSVADLIIKKLKNGNGSDQIASEADRLQQHLINENNAMIEKYQKEANNIMEFVNKNKSMVDKAIASGEYSSHQAIEIPNMTLAEALTDENTINSFSNAFDNSYNTSKRIENLEKRLGKDPGFLKKQWVEKSEAVANAGKSLWNWGKGMWNKLTKTEAVKGIGNTIDQLLTNKSNEEIAAAKFERGDQYEDKWKTNAKNDAAELSLKDVLTNLKNHKELTEEYKKLNMKDVVGLNELGIDFRLKNEYIQNPLLKQAHKAFIKGDEVEKSKLRLLGISSIDDLRKRKNDLYEYLLLKGQDTSELDNLFNRYAGISQIEYEKNVLEPIRKLKQSRNIDATESIANKLMKIGSVYKTTDDLSKELIESRLKLFDSREGVDAVANNNRVRDMIKEVFQYKNKAETNPRENKIKNLLIAKLTSLMSQDGFMNYNEEKELMSDSNFGRKFFEKNNKSIFNADYLKDEANVKEAKNRIANYIDYRRNYMRANDKIATQKTFNEIATANTGINFMAKTPGEKYSDIKDIIDSATYEDFGKDDQIESEELYERNKRIGKFTTALSDQYGPQMKTIIGQIDDKRKISLKDLDQMYEKAKSTNNEQELIEYGKNINKGYDKVRTKQSYAYINDRDIMDDYAYGSRKTKEYMSIIHPSKDGQYHDVSKLPMNKVVEENGKYLFKTINAIGDTLTTEIDPKSRKQYLYAYNESNHPQTLSDTVNTHDIEISNEGKQALHKFMNNPKGLNEMNIQRIADDSFLKISSPHEVAYNYEPQLELQQNNYIDQQYMYPKLSYGNTESTERIYQPVHPETSAATAFELAHENKPLTISPSNAKLYQQPIPTLETSTPTGVTQSRTPNVDDAIDYAELLAAQIPSDERIRKRNAKRLVASMVDDWTEYYGKYKKEHPELGNNKRANHNLLHPKETLEIF